MTNRKKAIIVALAVLSTMTLYAGSGNAHDEESHKGHDHSAKENSHEGHNKS